MSSAVQFLADVAIGAYWSLDAWLDRRQKRRR